MATWSASRLARVAAPAIGALLIGALPVYAPTTSAQTARVRVIAVRSYAWAGAPRHPERAPRLRGLVRDAEGVWTECAHVTGVAAEGTFDAAVARSRSVGPEPHHADHTMADVVVDCALTDVAPAPAEPVALLGGVPAHFGPFALGTERADLATLLGVDAATLPEATDARTIVRHGPYHLAFRNGWLMVAAAFLDELPGVAASGSASLARSAPFDEVVERLGLALHGSRGSIGRSDVFEPDLPHADATRLSLSRIRMGHAVGAVELDGRVLLYASYLQRDPEVLARLRSLILHHVLSARAGGG